MKVASFAREEVVGLRYLGASEWDHRQQGAGVNVGPGRGQLLGFSSRVDKLFPLGGSETIGAWREEGFGKGSCWCCSQQSQGESLLSALTGQPLWLR